MFFFCCVMEVKITCYKLSKNVCMFFFWGGDEGVLTTKLIWRIWFGKCYEAHTFNFSYLASLIGQVGLKFKVTCPKISQRVIHCHSCIGTNIQTKLKSLNENYLFNLVFQNEYFEECLKWWVRKLGRVFSIYVQKFQPFFKHVLCFYKQNLKI